MQRPLHTANVQLFEHAQHERPYQTLLNVRKLLDSWQLLGEQPLSRSFARQLLTTDKRQTLDGWLASLPEKARDPERARWLADELRQRLEPVGGKSKRPPASLTYAKTAQRSFEVAYWKTIAFLSAGDYVNKNNADPISDAPTQRLRPNDARDLELLGAYLRAHYADLIANRRMTGKALVGEMPFPWQTEFHYPWMGGWLHNREGKTHERNVVVVIPGHDRSQVVLMADHYDTAYMEDHYWNDQDVLIGARLATEGADDNCSATAALMLGAPIFLDLSRAGKLDCDVWLIHLTGEEYPADCLGGRQLCQRLVEGCLKIRTADGKDHDLSGVSVRGLYILDMVAHNNNRDRDVFQIAPGTSRESLWLAHQAHQATEIWNASLPSWNQRAARREAGRGRRSPDPRRCPAVARHLHLYGEVRPTYDPRSTLYNTDVNEFSDAGVPAVLFMENYDIRRSGYHDSSDTMGNINLDYGAALAAITIEAVARAATEKPPEWEAMSPAIPTVDSLRLDPKYRYDDSRTESMSPAELWAHLIQYAEVLDRVGEPEVGYGICRELVWRFPDRGEAWEGLARSAEKMGLQREAQVAKDEAERLGNRC
jgi:hypothetical protein